MKGELGAVRRPVCFSKMARSAPLIGSANRAFRNTRQRFQLEPMNACPKSSGLSSAVMMLKGLGATSTGVACMGARAGLPFGLMARHELETSKGLEALGFVEAAGGLAWRLHAESLPMMSAKLSGLASGDAATRPRPSRASKMRLECDIQGQIRPCVDELARLEGVAIEAGEMHGQHCRTVDEGRLSHRRTAADMCNEALADTVHHAPVFQAQIDALGAWGALAGAQSHRR